jgi:L-alanine-DL-glutamate epimerase-like enolase superfamily enzyme
MARPRLRITRVETIPLHVPFHDPFLIAAGPARPAAEVLLVRLHTDAGLQGVGETQAWRRIGSSETLPGMVAVIRNHMERAVVGRSPFEAPLILSDCDRALSGSLYPKAALADALLDLQARALDVPAWHLLGGKMRDTLPAAAVLTIKETLEETVQSARRFVVAGHRSATLKIGLDMQADIALVTALRARVPELALRPDANSSLQAPSAAAFLRKLQDAGVEAIEQPLPPWDLQGMADLARRLDVPLIADESVCTRQDLLQLIRERGASGIQTKVAKNGGAWRTRTLWEIAEAAGLSIYPGNHPSTSIAVASVLHLAASWPGALEAGPYAVGINGTLAAEVVSEPLAVTNGAVRVPEGPGFGVTLDDEKIFALQAVREL